VIEARKVDQGNTMSFVLEVERIYPRRTCLFLAPIVVTRITYMKQL
jgi:hypothetical protein